MDEEAVAAGSLESAEGYRLLIGAVKGYAILIVDPNGYIISWNSGAERIKGYSADEIIGRHLSVFYPEEDVRSGKVEYELAQARRHGRFEDESWRIRKDGSRFWANVVITALVDDTGALRGFGKVTRDMTERRQFERDLDRARENAAAADRAKDRFLSNMSHELRTPLNAVLGFSQVLELEPLTDDQQESVRHIIKAGQHLLDLINEILDISRISSGQMSLSLEAVSITEMVREAVTMVGPMAASRGIRLVSNEVRDDYVLVDRQRMKQVLLNLLSNAIKYNVQNGEVVLTTSAGEPGRLLVRVRDTGIGIAASLMERLFLPFDRLGVDAAAVEGTGLGLALSQALVEAMGGRLTAVSALASGSTFTLDLALTEPPANPPERPANDTADRVITPAGDRASIVYIEDNLSNLRLIEQILRRRPAIDLIPAMQGQLGLDLIMQHRPTLVLLDLHLPDLSGEDVLRRLKGRPETAHIPVVVMSADATPGLTARVLNSGAAEFITKPIDVNRFLDLVDRLCGPDASTPQPTVD